MLVLFRRNDVTGFAILVFVTFILRLPYFITPPSIAELGTFYTSSFGPLNWLKDLYQFAPRIYIFLSAIFWLGFSIYFKQVLVNQRLLHHRDFVASVALILSISALPPFMILSVAAISALAIFVALGMILGTQYNRAARSRYFGIGSAIGLAVILYWPSIIVLLAAIIVLLSIRVFVWQELIALLLGFLLPLYLVLTLYYIFTGHFFHTEELALRFSLPVAIDYPMASLVFIIFVILITFYGIYRSRSHIGENRILIVKKWNGVVLFLLAGLITGLSASHFPAHVFVLALVPFSIILSSALTNNHKKYNTFTFYFVLIVVLALQWVLRLV